MLCISALFEHILHDLCELVKHGIRAIAQTVLCQRHTPYERVQEHYLHPDYVKAGKIHSYIDAFMTVEAGETQGTFQHGEHGEWS